MPATLLDRPRAAAGAATGRPWRAGTAVLLVALAVVAAVLRAGPLGPSSLWLDDAAPALSHRAGSLHLVLATGMAAPGFTVLLRLVFEVSGFGELQAQALPFLLGVLGPPLAWWAGRRAGLRAGAVVAAAVLLVAPEHVVYASRVKPYTLDAALGLLLIVAALMVLRAPQRRRPWLVLSALASVAVPLSAATVPTVVAAFAAAWWSASRRQVLSRIAVVGTAVTAAVALGVWAGLLRPASTPALAQQWSPYFLPLDDRWPAAFADAVGRVTHGLLPLPAALGASVLVASAVVLVLRRDVARTVLLLGPFVVSTVLASAGLVPLGGGRTDVHLFASLALLVGTAADRVGVPAAALAAAGLLALAPSPPPYPASDVRPLVERLEREATPGDGTLVYSATRWAFGVYTSGPLRVERTTRQANGFEPVPLDPDVHVLGAHRTDPEGHRPEVAALACDRTRVWFLASHTTPDVETARDALADLGFGVAAQHERPGAVLQRWERPAAGC